jgi:hypothetical protein
VVVVHWAEQEMEVERLVLSVIGLRLGGSLSSTFFSVSVALVFVWRVASSSTLPYGSAALVEV